MKVGIKMFSKNYDSMPKYNGGYADLYRVFLEGIYDMATAIPFIKELAGESNLSIGQLDHEITSQFVTKFCYARRFSRGRCYNIPTPKAEINLHNVELTVFQDQQYDEAKGYFWSPITVGWNIEDDPRYGECAVNFYVTGYIPIEVADSLRKVGFYEKKD